MLDDNHSAAGEIPAAPLQTGEVSVSVSDARKAFGVTRALDGCSFSARFGEIHAIVGGNGCGKSTLAKVISGVLPVDRGKVAVLGQAPGSPREARDLGIATVFQEVLVADECSVVDNLYVGSDTLWSKTVPTSTKIRNAEALMRELTGLDIDPHTLVGTLPLSVKSWITIGRALLRKPKLLILDESSAALDFDSTERLFAKMRELRDQGATVLIVTHRIAELIRISDRATVMRDGKDVGVLDKHEITEKNLLRLMTGKADTHKSVGEAVRVAEHEEVVLKAEKLVIWPDAEPVDFALRRGEIVGVAGLDGQGQSEFVRILAGVQHAVQGAPEVKAAGGLYAAIRNLFDARKYGVAYVSGDRKREGIFPNLSIFENLLQPLYRRNLHGGILGIINWSALTGLFDSEVERLSIKMGDRAHKITSLSGGNQQKVLIGRSFALHPGILVLNDPARGIDVGAKAELYKHLREFAGHGNSVVFMSSELEEFIGLASRVIVFRHGSIYDAFEGSAVDPVRILEAMFGQTKGLSGSKVVTLQQRSPQRMKIVDFDKEKAAEPVVKDIKIVDFSRDEVEEFKKPSPIKIVEFGEEKQEEKIRKSIGRIKIKDFDKQSDPETPSGARIKIVEFGR